MLIILPLHIRLAKYHPIQGTFTSTHHEVDQVRNNSNKNQTQSLIETTKSKKLTKKQKRALIRNINKLSAILNTLEVRAQETNQMAHAADEKATSVEENLQEFLTPAKFSEYLDKDTFTLMMTATPLSYSWWFGMAIYIMQIILLTFLFMSITPANTTPFNVPFNVLPSVRATQCLSITIIVLTASDVIMPIKEISMLWYTNYDQWVHVVSCNNAIDETCLLD